MERYLSNYEVVQRFDNGQDGMSHTKNLVSDGKKLWSYSTVIAQWDGSTLLVNTRGYSATTRSKHQTHLWRTINRLNGEARFIDDMDLGVQDLSKYPRLEQHETNQKYFRSI